MFTGLIADVGRIVALSRRADGARLTVEDSKGVPRWRERTSGASFLSSSDPRLVVGLGDADGPARRVTVDWPTGGRTIYENLEVDRYWLLDETSGAAQDQSAFSASFSSRPRIDASFGAYLSASR